MGSRTSLCRAPSPMSRQWISSETLHTMIGQLMVSSSHLLKVKSVDGIAFDWLCRDWIDRTLTSILLIGWKLNASVWKSGYELFDEYTCDYCVCLFLFLLWWCDTVFLFHMILTFRVSYHFSFSLLLSFWSLSTKCFFVQRFCSCANNHFDRKILTTILCCWISTQS